MNHLLGHGVKRPASAILRVVRVCGELLRVGPDAAGAPSEDSWGRARCGELRSLTLSRVAKYNRRCARGHLRELRRLRGRTPGSDVASEILSDQPVFLLSEAYEDERLLALINRASELTGIPESELVHQVGVFTAQQTFARLYPAFFAVAGGTRAFLLSVEAFIHELVRATIPNASPPRLHVQPLGDDGVTIIYTSSRRLCALLAGLVEGTARHYGEEVEVDQTDCMLRDDPACVFEIRVSPGMLAA